uniref:Discoidin domain-containing protein n=1 Tax=Janibacter limosus TaxID=53458 RepID=A0AC61U1F5_9MICO|nr:discoidin domain-containing protein [Janibacter limosus]
MAAIDGDPATRWRPSARTAEPTLAVDLGAERQVSTITLDRPSGSVTVATDSGRYVLPSGTTLQIPEQRTRSLSLTFTRPPGRASWAAPEVGIAGLSGPTGQLTLPCTEAGAVGRADGRIGLSLTASRRALIAGDPVAATACGDLPAGDGEISALAVPGLLPETVSLVPTGWTRTDVAPERTVTSRRDHVGRWVFEVGPGTRSVLALSRGANAGWRATDDRGRRLEPVTVDGWRRAFVVPTGSTTKVVVDFAPNGQHRLALAAGAALVAVLLLWALLEMVLRRRDATRDVDAVTDDARAEETPIGTPGNTPAARRGADQPAPVLLTVLTAVLVAALVGLLVAGPVGMMASVIGALVPVRRRALWVAPGPVRSGGRAGRARGGRASVHRVARLAAARGAHPRSAGCGVGATVARWARSSTGRSTSIHDRCPRPTLTIVTRSRVGAKGAAKSRRSRAAKTTCRTRTCQRKTA